LKIKYLNSQMIFFIFFLLALLFAFSELPRISLPLLMAYVIGLLVSPMIPMICKLGINRTFSIVLIMFGLVFLIVLPFFKLVPTIKKESENLQYYIPKIESFFRGKYYEVQKEIQSYVGIEVPDSFLEDILSYGETTWKMILLNVPNAVQSILEWILLVPFFLFFLLRDGPQIKKTFLNLVPNIIFERAYYLFSQFNKRVGDYIVAKFIEASIVGLIVITGLIFLGVRFSFLLGITAAITNIVPYLGPILGLIPAVIVGLVEFGVGPALYALLILYTVANIVDLAFVFPFLVSKLVDIHPLIVVVSVILGSQYAGIVGMIISIPVAVIVKLLLTEIYNEVYSSHSFSE
jgi:putative permease